MFIEIKSFDPCSPEKISTVWIPLDKIGYIEKGQGTNYYVIYANLFCGVESFRTRELPRNLKDKFI